jgi:hypothetical protein
MIEDQNSTTSRRIQPPARSARALPLFCYFSYCTSGGLAHDEGILMVSLGHLMSDLEQGLSYCTPEWSSGITGSPLAQSKGPESKISTAYCTGAISSGGQMSPPASPYCTVVQYVVENSFSGTLAEAGGQAVGYTSTADDIWRKEQPHIQPLLPVCLPHVLYKMSHRALENTDH